MAVVGTYALLAAGSLDVVDISKPGRPTAAAARTFLRRYTSRMDAYVMTWSPYDRRARAVVERIAALMPSADAATAKDIPSYYGSGEPRH